MEYRFDEDLEFLQDCPDHALEDLLNILVYDPKDGKNRISASITSEPLYIEHFPEHSKYWHLIAAELQTFGANSLVSRMRGGKGVPYREILSDVCSRLGVKFNKKSDIKTIEYNLLQKVSENRIEQMTEEEINDLFKQKNSASNVFGISAMLGLAFSSSIISLTALPTITHVTGPAYRVTIPAVIKIATLRFLKNTEVLTSRKS